MTADIDAVLSRLREQLTARIEAQREQTRRVMRGHLRCMAERDEIAAERDQLREALVLMREWCLDGEEPDGHGDLIAHVNRLLGESPVPDEPTGAERYLTERLADAEYRAAYEASHPTGEERTDG